MRYGLVSDIHANLQAWKAVWTDIHAFSVDEIICLGDIVGYGPRPAETLADVYANVHHIIMGNHEAVIAGLYDASGFNPDAKRMIEWTDSQLDKKAAEIFVEFPMEMVIEAGDAEVLCVHGAAHQSESFPYILEEKDARKTWDFCDHPLIFVGHTHRPRIDMLDADGNYGMSEPKDFTVEPGCRYIVNVGSVGMSRHADFRACYVIFDTETGEITYHRTAFDIETFKREVNERVGPVQQVQRLLAAFEGAEAGPVREQLDFSPTIAKVKDAARRASQRRRSRVVARSGPWSWLRGGTQAAAGKEKRAGTRKREPTRSRTTGRKRDPTSTRRKRRPSTRRIGLGRFFSDAASGIKGTAKSFVDSFGRPTGTSRSRKKKRPRDKSGEERMLSLEATYEASSIDKSRSEHINELLSVRNVERERGYLYAYCAEKERTPSRLVVTLLYSADVTRIVALFRDRIPEELKIRVSRDGKNWNEVFRGPGEDGVWDIPVDLEERTKFIWIGLTAVGAFRPYAVQVFGME